jgi:mRNA deadenylase 3'-5' endonuclease subunit Ccr4
VIESSLDWNHRRMILIRQLEELDADILCLEELSDYWTYV